MLQKGLHLYVETFDDGWNSMMSAKLGLDKYRGEEDQRLFSQLFDVLQLAETDMTLFYRRLADVPSDVDAESVCDLLQESYYKPEEINDDVRTATADWFARYQDRLASAGVSDEKRRERMNRINPLYVLRNYLAQLAIDRSEQGDHSGIAELLEVLRHPYDEQPGREAYAEKRPEWARHRAGCSMLSCSS